MNDRQGLGDTGSVFMARQLGEHNLELVSRSVATGSELTDPTRDASDLMDILGMPFNRPAHASVGELPPTDRGKCVIVTGKRIEGTVLGLVITYDVAEALQPVREFQISLLGFGLIGALLVGVISVLFGRSLSSPILPLVEVVAEIRGGKLERRAHVRSSDEIGALAHSFNEMTNELVSTNATLEDRVARRGGSTGRLGPVR